MRLPSENKRCHKRCSESMPKPPPSGSNSLFKGLRAILECRQVGRKIIYSGYGSNGQFDGFGTISMGDRLGAETSSKLDIAFVI